MTEEEDPLTLGFVRGVAPEKWARRWTSVRRRRPLNLVPLPEIGDVDPASTDMTLVRSWPGQAPSRSRGADRTRHAVQLYEEAVALVVSVHDEAAQLRSLSVDELALVSLIDHPWHDPSWPSPKPWKDPSWRPTSIAAALDIVTTGLGGILLPGPLARHLTRKRDHRIVHVSEGPSGERLPGSLVWATWEVARDSNEMQELIGVLRGRTVRSSRS